MYSRFYSLAAKKIEHAHSVYSDDEADQMASWIAVAMSRTVKTFLFFENPAICYNPDNVIGVGMTGLTAEEIEKAVSYAQRKAGYVKT